MLTAVTRAQIDHGKKMTRISGTLQCFPRARHVLFHPSPHEPGVPHLEMARRIVLLGSLHIKRKSQGLVFCYTASISMGEPHLDQHHGIVRVKL